MLVDVVPVRPEDYADMAVLYTELDNEVKKGSQKHDFAKLISERYSQREFWDGYRAFVAKQSEWLVGFIELDLKAEGCVAISLVFVRYAQRYRGIGRALMEAAMRWIGEDAEMQLSIPNWAEETAGFFTTMEFEPIQPPGERVTKQDAIWMKRGWIPRRPPGS